MTIEIKSNVIVETKDAKLNGKVVEIAKGWFTVALIDGTQIKARAKQLSADLDADAIQLQEIVDAVEAIEAGGLKKMSCVACDHKWGVDLETEKAINVRCPDCGAWNNVRLTPDRDRYIRGLDKTASGNDTFDIGDDVANKLRGLSVAECLTKAGNLINMAWLSHGGAILSKKMAKDLGDSIEHPQEIANHFDLKYADRNAGMVRMNLGNILRGINDRIENLPQMDEAMETQNHPPKA